MARPKKIEAAVIAPRTRITAATFAVTGGTSYFASSEERTSLEFFSSGNIVLDQALGGGYVLGRVENIIGDKSTGKTLQAIEGCVNFEMTFPDGVVRYGEAESAFDQPYAKALGMKTDKVEWVDWSYSKEGRTPKQNTAIGLDEGTSDRTVERWYEDMVEFVQRLNGRPGLYVLDSLDSLSSRDELARGISDASFGQEKAKKIGELFRRLVGVLEDSRVCVIIISQVRDNIGVTFGNKYKRSGGHAMDFYATHCIWLAYTGAIKQTVSKITRAVGVGIKAKVDKNKVGLPKRECEYNIMFGYGMDDVEAACRWLVSAGKGARLAEVGMSEKGYAMMVQHMRNSTDRAPLREARVKLSRMVIDEWRAVEMTFLPPAGKY